MKLTYFNVHSRGQPIRLIFSLADVEYEEDTIKLGVGVNLKEEWLPRKSSFPLGFIPVLETDDGELIPQSVAITSYLSLKYEMKGNTERDRMVSTVIAESANDLLAQCGKGLHVFLVYKYYPVPDEDGMQKSKDDVTLSWQKLCTLAEKYQQFKYPEKLFINGDKITEADIWLWSVAEYIRQAIPDLERSKWYKHLEENFLSDEGVKKYLVNRLEAAY